MWEKSRVFEKNVKKQEKKDKAETIFSASPLPRVCTLIWESAQYLRYVHAENKIMCTYYNGRKSFAAITQFRQKKMGASQPTYR